MRRQTVTEDARASVPGLTETLIAACRVVTCRMYVTRCHLRTLINVYSQHTASTNNKQFQFELYKDA